MDDVKVSKKTLNKVEKYHQLNWKCILSQIWNNEFKKHGISLKDFFKELDLYKEEE